MDTKDLKEKIDVKDLLEEYSLDKITDEGEWVKSVCPYHTDINPSFCMRKSDTYFHCWSCEAKGDAIQFIMDMENVSFKEALDKLIAITGYTITQGSQLEYLKRIWFRKEDPDKEGEPELLEDSRIFKLNKMAQEWFVNELPTSLANSYVKERGYSLEVCRDLGVGFCPQGFVAKAVHEWKFSHDEVYIAGFIRGDSSERFIDRVTFPIYNTAGNIVAFTARAIDGSEPKYSNTPNSPFYKKSHFLFGIEDIRAGEPIILVEGNFDRLRLSSQGINCLANLGGAFSDKQAQIMQKYTDKVTIFYDGDESGRTSTIKTFLVLLKHGLKVYVINLADGLDPDIAVQGLGELHPCDAMMHYVTYQKNSGYTEVRILSNLLRIVAKIKKQEERAYNIERLAKIFDLSLETIQSEIKKS